MTFGARPTHGFQPRDRPIYVTRAAGCGDGPLQALGAGICSPASRVADAVADRWRYARAVTANTGLPTTAAVATGDRASPSAGTALRFRWRPQMRLCSK